jgi:hypothetical protein
VSCDAGDALCCVAEAISEKGSFMGSIPAVDPIPLPAPVWLFKALHLLTLSLHFIAVETLVGGLLIATVLSFLASAMRNHPRHDERRAAAAALAKRLPVVMTYVINLGVPPLLFAQVLYGRALYTSSVLIGAYWIAIIPLLMACYWLLYRFAAGTEAGKNVWWIGLLAWLIAGFIAHILSSNMTLMLRPEVWQAMYFKTASGTQLPTGDPTILPRWLFMMVGGLWVAGLWMIWIASETRVIGTLKGYLAELGAKLAVPCIIAQAAILAWVIWAQPQDIQGDLRTKLLSLASAGVWAAAGLLVALIAFGVAIKRIGLQWAAYGGLVATLLAELSWTVLRDAIRDLTLASKGFDVWDRAVETNWSVVGLFLLVFVAGLVVLGWLISVMMRARPIVEGTAP